MQRVLRSSFFVLRPSRRIWSASQRLADAAPMQDLQLLSNEEVAKLRAALDALPEAQRAALELAYYEGLTHAEIAHRLSEPLGTVKTRIRQAVIRLRRTYQLWVVTAQAPISAGLLTPDAAGNVSDTFNTPQTCRNRSPLP